MKTIKYLIYTLIATFVFQGCSDDPTYTPGEPENPNCYGVYFPTQEKTGIVEFAPTAPPEMEFTVMRTKYVDAITVPVVVSASEEGIFNVAPIVFQEGETETTFKVTFPQAKIGSTYSCKINITDNQYVSIYDSKSSGLDFSLVRVQWNAVKGNNGEELGSFTEAFIGLIFENGSIETGSCKVFERADRKGYYRFENPYNQPLVDAIFRAPRYASWGWAADLIVDATDANKVTIAPQEIGLSVNKGSLTGEFGSIRIATKGGLFGTLEDGIITFPAKSLGAAMEKYEGGAYVFTSSQKVTFSLPGAKASDYSVVLSKSEPLDGKTKLGVKLGADVATMKYAFFEGSLSATLATAKSNDMAAGLIPTKEITEKNSVLSVEMEKTGIYTIVGNIYNAAGVMISVQYMSFGYVKAGEAKPVILGLGINVTDKFAPAGNTSKNSLEVYAYGEKIESASYFFIETNKLAADADLAALAKANGTAFSAAQLQAINGTGFSGVFGKLNAGTSYTFAILANNGYVSKVFSTKASTTGDATPLQRNYTSDDLIGKFSKPELFKTWNLWGVEYEDDKPLGDRKMLGKVEISENTTNDITGVDAINLKGLSLGYSNVDDTIYWAYDAINGAILTLKGQSMGWRMYQGAKRFLGSYFVDTKTGMGASTIDNMMIGIKVAEGYMAFVSHPVFTGLGYNFDAMLVMGYSDVEWKNSTGYYTWSVDLMLEDPAVAVTSASNAESIRAQINDVAKKMQTAPENYVELQGPQLLRALQVKLAGKTLSTTSADMPELGVADAKVSVSEGSIAVQFQSGPMTLRKDIKMNVIK